MKKKFATLVALALVMAFVAGSNTSVQAASAKGYHKGEGSWAYIVVAGADGNEEIIFHPQGVETGFFELDKVKGVSYNEKTNTLTLKNFKRPDACISVNEMGSDFKIKLVGKNELSYISVWGYGYAGCLELTGSGTLTLNKSKNTAAAFVLRAERSAASLKVGKKVKLNAYAGKETGISVNISESTITSAEKTFLFNGRKSIKDAVKDKQELVELTEKLVEIKGEDFTNLWYDNLYTLTKGGKSYFGFVFPGDEGFEYYICKGTGEYSDGFEIVQVVKQITEYKDDPFAEAGYSYKKAGSVYNYTFKGNLILK